jgi:transposase
VTEKGGEDAGGGHLRGGRQNNEIHCLADSCGRIVAIALTPGNIADITMAQPLLEALAPTKRLIADKAYDADRLREWLATRSIEAVIPARSTRASVYPINKAAYRRRNIIERMFGRLKNWKRIATRYDRLAVNFMAAIALVALATQWLK